MKKFTNTERKDYIYAIYDKVSDTLIASYKGVNDKDVIRELVLCGFFKYNRIRDIDIYNTGLYLVEKGGVVSDKNITFPKKVDIMKTLEELAVKIENEAEKIEGTVDEVKEKIYNKNKGGEN